MKKLLCVAGIAVLSLAGCREGGGGAKQEAEDTFGGLQQGAEDTGQRAQDELGSAAGAQGEQAATGRITSADANRIEVQTDQGETLSFNRSPDAEILQNGQPIGFEALQEGQQVRATYSEEGGEQKLQKLELIQAEGQQPGQEPGQQPGSIGGPTQQDGSQQQPGQEPMPGGAGGGGAQP